MSENFDANHRAFTPHKDSGARWWAGTENWWDDHYRAAPAEILDFLHADGVQTEGKHVVDLGCGGGEMTLGLARSGRFASVTGVDIVDVDVEILNAQARRCGVDGVQPQDAVRFLRSEPRELPLPDNSVDLVCSWSVFEHVGDPDPLLAEVRRVLVPDGLFFVQIWPLWFSEHGSHLWPFFDETWVHLTRRPDDILEHLRGRMQPLALADSLYDVYDSCNQITVDELQQALRTAGFYLAKVSLSGSSVHVPPSLQDVPLSKLAIEGVKILAVSH